MINFSISETMGRTFELEESKIHELYNQFEYAHEDAELEERIHRIICELGFEVFEEYEKNNDYCELTVEEVNEV